MQQGRAGGPLRGGDDRRRAGEDLGLARVSSRRLGLASAFLLPADVGVPEPLLLLHPRPRVGPGFHQDGRLRPIRRSGSISTGTSGPSARPPSAGSALRRWITAFARSRTPTRCRDLRHALLARHRAFLGALGAHLPSPLTAEDRERGYHYRLSVRQLELSDTRVFERPAQVREWFELTLKDQLALGRPDNVQIVFGRKIISRTPGRFRTRDHQRRRRAADPGALQALQGQAVPQGRPRAQNRDHDQRPQRLRRRQDSERHQLAGADAHRPRDQRAAPVRSACGVRLRARLDHAAAGRVAVDRGRPTSTRPALRRTPGDGAALLPVLLPPPVRRADQQEPARARSPGSSPATAPAR